MTTDFTTSYCRVMIWRVRKAAQLGGVPKTCRVLDSQVRRQRLAALREGEQSGRSRLLNEKHLWESTLCFGGCRDARLERKSARARRWRHGTSGRRGWTWAYGRASVCFGSWVFGYASLVSQLGKPIRKRQKAQKTPRTAGRCPRSTTGPLTKATSSSADNCRMWVRPSNKDPVLHATLRCRVFVRWKVSVLLGTG